MLKPYHERWEQRLKKLSERRLAELTLMRDGLKK